MPFWQWYVHNTFNSFSVFYLKVMLPSELSHALGWENPNFCSLCLDLSGELCLCFFLDLSEKQHSSSKFVPIQCISFSRSGTTNASRGIQISFVESLKFQFPKTFSGNQTSLSMRCESATHTCVEHFFPLLMFVDATCSVFVLESNGWTVNFFN